MKRSDRCCSAGEYWSSSTTCQTVYIIHFGKVFVVAYLIRRPVDPRAGTPFAHAVATIFPGWRRAARFFNWSHETNEPIAAGARGHCLSGTHAADWDMSRQQPVCLLGSRRPRPPVNVWHWRWGQQSTSFSGQITAAAAQLYTSQRGGGLYPSTLVTWVGSVRVNSIVTHTSKCCSVNHAESGRALIRSSCADDEISQHLGKVQMLRALDRSRAAKQTNVSTTKPSLGDGKLSQLGSSLQTIIFV